MNSDYLRTVGVSVDVNRKHVSMVSIVSIVGIVSIIIFHKSSDHT